MRVHHSTATHCCDQKWKVSRLSHCDTWYSRSGSGSLVIGVRRGIIIGLVTTNAGVGCIVVISVVTGCTVVGYGWHVLQSADNSRCESGNVAGIQSGIRQCDTFHS
jgi:hypothetical protein